MPLESSPRASFPSDFTFRAAHVETPRSSPFETIFFNNSIPNKINTTPPLSRADQLKAIIRPLTSSPGATSALPRIKSVSTPTHRHCYTTQAHIRTQPLSYPCCSPEGAQGSDNISSAINLVQNQHPLKAGGMDTEELTQSYSDPAMREIRRADTCRSR